MICETTHLNIKKLSSWYAFMRFQESWYSSMGFLDVQDVLILVTTVNPVLFQVQLRQLFPSQLNNVSPCKCQFTSCLWMVCLFCRAVYLGLYMCCNRELQTYFDTIFPVARQYSEIDYIDLHNNGIFPVIEF